MAIIRNLEFSSSLDSSDCLVMGDETLLRRLADILLDNAFKYTPAPGWIHLTLQLKSESAVIIVQDSGVGISAEEHGKIFERFYRVDKARSRAQGGVGLGLAIAKWIVTRHRGSITRRKPTREGDYLSRRIAHDLGSRPQSPAGLIDIQNSQLLPYNRKTFPTPGWRNWQTQRTQKRMLTTS